MEVGQKLKHLLVLVTEHLTLNHVEEVVEGLLLLVGLWVLVPCVCRLELYQ